MRAMQTLPLRILSLISLKLDPIGGIVSAYFYAESTGLVLSYETLGGKLFESRNLGIYQL